MADNTATLGGTITNSTAPSLIGQHIAFTGVDNTSMGSLPDTINDGTLGLSGCVDPNATQLPLFSGDIVVHDYQPCEEKDNNKDKMKNKCKQG